MVKKDDRREDEKFLNFSVSKDIHHKIKKIAFEAEISLAEVCREAITEFLNKNKKKGK